jgi:predicted AAA+ superfamily ATPase
LTIGFLFVSLQLKSIVAMERILLNKLLEWKEMPNRKPLIIRGARQTGKTWLMREFGKKAFKKMVYVNFENEPRFRDLFIKDYNTARIISMLELHLNEKIDAEDTLLIFDEIQAVDGGLTSLKYFCEEAPQYAIVAAGSLLGISFHANQSFPVGKVDFLDLYPMSLEEFMCAAGKKMLWDAMVAQEWDMVATFHDELLQMLRIYMYVGGMPEVVKQWVDNQDFFAVREKQQNILRSYVADFSKHIPDDQVPRVNMVWDSLPAQLAKENKKFIYGIIRDGARAKDFELAIMWLYNCGLVLKSHRVKVPSMPLKAYQDFQTFKLFMVDVGLLGAAVGLQTQMLLEGNRLFTEFKGALAEQYVMQELSAQNFDYIGYWTNERSTAEVDFVIQQKGEVVPIEVKSGENLRSRSFTQFCRTYEPKIAFKASTLPYHGGMEIVNVPLYGIIAALSAGQ